LFGYYTGGRLSELLNLHRNDIDLKEMSSPLETKKHLEQRQAR
jgi:integrase